MKYTFKEYVPTKITRGHLNMGGKNPSGEFIDVTNLYFERNGRPWIGVMGEFHFSRCAREDWGRELAKMKAGGINIVSTYLFWIHHEEIEGEFDFSSNRDIHAFVEEARALGLDVVLRPGPWAHGECRNGGFPDWLMKKPFRLRSRDEGYLAAVKRFFERIANETRGLYFSEGGNIIGVQIENECVDDADYLLELKRMVVELGMNVPLYTVTGWNSVGGARIPVDEVVPMFGGYCALPWEQHIRPLEPSEHYFFIRARNNNDIGSDLLILKPQNDDGWSIPYEKYPYATCEIGGGSQVTHHRRPLIDPMDIYAMALVKLGCGNNLPGYYMYHGGTNPTGKLSAFQESRDTGYPNDLPVLSYDFQAPISEYGEIREHYRLLNMLHLFLQDFGGELAPMEAVDAESFVSRYDNKTLRAALRTNGKSGFVFINHHQRRAVLEDVLNVELEACGVSLPPIDVKGDIAFFMPIGMDIGTARLDWATAQPICRYQDTYFFTAVPGLAPVYSIGGRAISAETGMDKSIKHGNIKIVTLAWDTARYLRRLDGRLYIGDGCDLYMIKGELRAAAEGGYAYWNWNGDEFIYTSVPGERVQAHLTRVPSDEPDFDKPYDFELHYGTGRAVRWERIEADSAQGFVEIPDECDVAQIYVDGKLAADNFYYGRPWRVPAKLLFGRECWLALSEQRDDAYWDYRTKA